MRAASITLLALLLAVSTTASAQEVLVLSPEPGERISGQEVLVAASCVGAGAKLEIDGVDYTAQAQIEGSVLTWKPAQPLAAGPHRAFVYALDANGKVIGQSDWSFTTMPLTESEAAAIKASGNAEPMTVGNTWLPHGTLILSGASASVSGAGSALRTTDNFQPNMWLNAGGLIGGGWRYSAHVHVSGAESEFQQPVNQYRFDLRGPFLRVSLGDVHPAMQSLILNGQRVRGVQGELRLGPARVSMVSGESRRAIPALVSTADGTVLRTGTFGQKLFAVRPAIGAGDRFQAGLTFMQV
ncbi:MAG: hypothetical protein ACT4O1_14615, partial [Gemmatimonadota bacterium]